MPSKAKTGKKLVIVESPAKSKTIAKYLGEGFIVEASIGHIRDLPQPSELPAELKKTPLGKFAVDIENDFKPYYVVSADKKKKVGELKAQLKDADALYLATDGDREGEAIAWHLLEVLKPKVPVYRMTFGEITKEAIHRAMDNLRDVDQDLVDAQETRRVLDRLYGYEISPVLWRKVARGLSAGRVQSVVTRMVVDRERERMAFKAASYWDLTGQFGAESGSFKAKLAAVDGAKVASGRDFNDDGELTARNVVHLNEELAASLAAGLQDRRLPCPLGRHQAVHPPSGGAVHHLHAAAGGRPQTALLLQEHHAGGPAAVRKRLHHLYAYGLVRTERRGRYRGPAPGLRTVRHRNTFPQSPSVYTSKAANAQEAHEAIRPAGDSFRTPAQVAKQLSGDEFRLYELIWKRTVASQMADAKGSTATIRLGAVTVGGAAAGRDAEFSASGTVITFPGFLAAYEEGKDESRGDEDTDEARRLPNVAKDDSLTASDIVAVGHETSPPPRYTEASLTAELEKKGIGRPSTYASTISTIQDRGYVRKQGSALVPSWIAFSVVRLLEQHFRDYVDYEFTADMEADLDKIANGEAAGPAWLKHFYFGEDADPGLLSIVNNLGEIDAREINSVPITDGITLRVGKFGPYLESSVPTVDPKTGEVVEAARANVPEDLAPDELTAAKAVELMETAAPEERVLGTDPHTGHTIVAKNGRYGAYVTEIIPEMTEEQLASQPVEYYKNGKPKPPKKPVKAKPRTGSLFASMSVETVTLDEALQLMSLPRVLGQDAEGNPITVQNGRFGPYLKKGTDSRSIGSEEEIFTITLEEALEIYSQPKQRGARAAVPPLAEFGPDPVSEKTIVVKEGRFGPYITDGITNITVPRDTALEELTREQAIALLAEKRAKGPVKRTTTPGPTRKPAAKKKGAKK